MTRDEFIAAMMRSGYDRKGAIIEWNRLSKDGWTVPEPGVERLNGGLAEVARLRNAQS